MLLLIVFHDCIVSIARLIAFPVVLFVALFNARCCRVHVVVKVSHHCFQ